jgi:glucose-1-phosphate thymidylyltransferase
MKGLILSGGAGTRLRPITHTSAKQLVPVANKPILFFGIEDMVEAGITEIGIITGETGPEIRAAVGDGSDFGAKITYIPQESPLGLAHCVLIARDFLGDDDFVMYLGDNLLRQGISEFVESFDADHSASAGVDRQVSSAQILLARVPDPQRFGVAEISASGEVTRLVEKPDDPQSDLALVGVYLFDRTIHQAVAAIEPSPRGELEITDAIQWLIDNGHRVRHEVLEGWWKDTGKLEPLLEGNRLVLDMFETSIEGSVDRSSVLEGMVIVQAGAEVINSTLRGPVIIGEGTRIIDSVVGPYASIYFDCTIVDSSIENSVILEETKIVGVKNISESLVGKQVDIHRASSDPAVRLMIGDHSVVELP